jgi:hypothetical protein
MVSLQSAEMDRPVFASVSKEREFAERLRKFKFRIRNIIFESKSYEGRTELSESGLILTNLTTLTWDLGKQGSLFKMQIMC